MTKAAEHSRFAPAITPAICGSEPTPSPETIQAKASAHKATVRARVRARATQQRWTPSRTSSKGEVILNLLRRKNGASISELQKATGWQPHSVCGFLSGTVRTRLRFKLKSLKPQKRNRRYFVIGA